MDGPDKTLQEGVGPQLSVQVEVLPGSGWSLDLVSSHVEEDGGD